MKWRGVQGGWMVVLQRGDVLHESLQRMAREAGLRSGMITGLGAVEDVQLAYWNLPARRYECADLAGDLEVGALVGNITSLNGEPFVHAHAVVGGSDFVAKTGHLMRARCAATVEIFIHDGAVAIERGMDPDIGLNLCRL